MKRFSLQVAAGLRNARGAAISCTALIVLAAGPASAGLPGPGFSKVFAPDPIGPGSTTTLTFTITNDGNPAPVGDLAFTDVLPAGITIATPSSAFTDCVDGALSAPDGGGTISLTGGTVGAGSACSVTVNVIGTATATNTSGDLTSGLGNSGPAMATLTVDTARPGFSKAFSPASIPLGTTSTLTFTVDNTASAVGVGHLFFLDLLPIGMVVATLPNASTDCDSGFGSTLTADPGTGLIRLFAAGFLPTFPVVAAGATCTVSVDVTTDGLGIFVNTSQELVIENEFGFPPVPDPDKAGFATAALDVPIDFLGKIFLGDPVAPGTSVTLQFTIQNPSRTEAATSIAFDDPLPAGLLFSSTVSDDCGGVLDTATPSLLSYSGGSLPPEGSCTLSVTLTVPGGATPDTYTNTTTAITATIGGEGVVGNAATDELTVNFAPTFTKEFLTNPVGAGGTTTLRFTITNNSSTSSLDSIAFVDVLNDVVPTAAVVPSNPVCNTGTGVFTPFFDGSDGNLPANYTVTGASLDPAETCTIDLTLDVVANATEGTYPNTTSLISGLVGGVDPVAGFPASDDLMVVGGPSLIKEFSGDPVNPPGTVTLGFTLSHSELAGGPATGIAFTDDLTFLTDLAATGLPLMAACDPDGPGGSPGTGTLSGTTLLDFSGGSLAPGESCSFSVTLDVPGTAATGPHTNTTSTLTATVTGLAVTGNPASDDLNIAGLTLTKEFLDDPVIPGETVTLELVIDNVSLTETATSISISDDMAAILGGTPGIAGDGVMVADVCGPGNGIITWSASGATANGNMTFSDGTLAPGEMCTFSVVLDVPAGAESGTYINSTGSLLGGPGFFANMPGIVVFDEAIDQLIVNNIFLDLTKEFTDDPVAPGGTANLRFTLTNLSSAETLKDIAFSDDLDAALPGLLATLPVAGCGGMATTSDGGMTIDFAGGGLGPSETCFFDVAVSLPMVSLGTLAVNTTSGVTGLTDPDDLGVTGTPATDELRISTLKLTKAFDGAALAGGTVTLTFTIDNLDASAGVSDLGFIDDLEAVVSGLVATGLPAAACGGTLVTPDGGSTVALLGGSLGPAGAAGDSCSFPVTLAVPAEAASGTHTNTTGDLLRNGISVADPAVADLEVTEVPIVVAEVATAAGPLAPCDTVTLPISRIEVTLAGSDQPFAGVVDPASYLLVGAGPNGDFSTAACAGGAAGDDIPIEIVSLSLTSVDPFSVTAELVPGGRLAAGLYRFLVCDEITNALGSPLDGDGNGTPGVDFSLASFRADPLNLFANGHFDDCPVTLDLSTLELVTLDPWVVQATPPNTIQPAAAGVDDFEGSPLSASAEITHSTFDPSALAQCVAVDAGVTYDLGARLRFQPTMDGMALFDRSCEFFDAAACGGASLGSSLGSSTLEDEGGVWTEVTDEVMSPASAVSALCGFTVEAVGDPGFDLFLDGLSLSSAPIFADGFESGGITAWSSSAR